MLKSRFDNEPARFRAQKIFTDRIVPSEVLSDSLADIGRAPMKIITYYGKGGIGKSRLLKELYNRMSRSDTSVGGITFQPVYISLDAYDYANPVNILTTIRNCIKADCSLFDYAMTLYCAKAKMNIEDIKDRQWNVSSNVIEHINDILALVTLNAAIPVKWIGTAISAIKDRRLQMTYRKEVLELSTLNEFDIFERLPHYLGLCLRQAGMENVVHVIFMDSYESLLARTFSQTASVECDEWLRELFLSSGQIRLVIGTRDKLKWEMQDPEWGLYMDQHLLDNLSDDDARWFLQQVPIHDERIIDYIVRYSKGIPLYLDMCVDVYESLYNTHEEELTVDLFKRQDFYTTRGKVIIERYLRHLTPKQHDSVQALSVLHSFSRSFVMAFLRQMGLPHYHDELSALLDKSIILSLDEGSDMWKLDESIREQIWNSLSPETKYDLIGGVLSITASDQGGHFFSYFAIVLERVIALPELAKGRMETLLQQVEVYANGGFWNEIHGLLAALTDNADERIRAIAVVGDAICLRRFGWLEKAAALLESHPLDPRLLGNFTYSYKFLKASISHLLGHYDLAITAYSALLDEMELVKGTLPLHTYIQTALKQTDLLMLKGRFDEALSQIDKILDKPMSPTDKVEALRIKGHIYRFRQEYAKALIIYQSALILVRDSQMSASIGKLYTNFVESNCLERPDDAIAILEKAIEYNHDNDIELTKCYAAASIAWCKRGDLSQAAQYADWSRQKAELSGYRSGMVFALAAKALLDHATGDCVALFNDIAQMESLTAELGVYLFIPQIVRQLCGESVS